MKSKLGAILLSTISAFALYGTVEAATLAIGNDSTTAGALNRSVSVELKDDDLKDYSKVEFQLSVDGTSYAELGLYSHKITSLAFNNNGSGVYTIGTDGGELFATTIGSISYKTTANLNSNFKITPTNVKFYKKDGSGYLSPGDSNIKATAGTISFEKEKSKDATLTNLVVSQGELTPAFDKDVTEYTVVIKDTISYIRVTPTAAAGATVTGGGQKSLALGSNSVELIVTAEDGNTKKTYNINVIRGEIAEPSAYLKEITINNIGVALSPEFDSKNNKYTVKISSDIKTLNIKPDLEDPLAKFEIEGNENFQPGENLITITVTSSDEVTKEVYEITAILEDEESTSTPITLPEEKNDTKKSEPKWWLIALIAGVIIVVVSCVAFILFKKNKKKKNQENAKVEPPLKKRIEKSSESENSEDYDETEDYNEQPEEDEDGVTDALKKELFEDEQTRRYDSNLIKEFRFEDEDEEGEYDDKTKEFNFRDLQ